MSLTIRTLVAALALTPAAAFSGDIAIADAYARSASPAAKTGAAFMQIVNSGAEDDVLIGVASDIAARVELHTHVENSEGVMRMTKIEGGIPVPAGETHHLRRGGDHVMFMGLSESLSNGSSVSVTLMFERAGEMTVEIPVDLERQPATHDHGATISN